MVFASSFRRNSQHPGSSIVEITVGSTEESVTSDAPTPRNVFLRLMSGDDLQVGVATGEYPFRLSGGNDTMLLRLDVEGLRETSSVVVTAENANTTLHEQFFTLEGLSGSWGVWFDVAGGGSDPTSTASSLEVATIGAGDSIANVGTKLTAALQTDAAFMADFFVSYDSDTNTIVITDRHTGERAGIADGTATTGFTFATLQAGEDSPTIYLKSAGTSQVLVGVIPD
jgi:hypothetical protein